MLGISIDEFLIEIDPFSFLDFFGVLLGVLLNFLYLLLRDFDREGFDRDGLDLLYILNLIIWVGLLIF